MSDVVDVIAPGLETSVQELPGRIGYWEQGFPPSGPIDFWSFRLANLLAGNDRDAAALECQLLGPTLRFTDDRAIAITGADMDAKLDGEPVPMWQTFTCAGTRCSHSPVRRRACEPISRLPAASRPHPCLVRGPPSTWPASAAWRDMR